MCHTWQGRFLGIACILGALLGCEGGSGPPGKGHGRPEPLIIPPGIAGTVAEFADLVGGQPLPVRGYGVVVGLGQAGSSEVPPNLRKVLVQQMLRARLHSPIAGTQGLTPARMLADKDTAVVAVMGSIPPAAPVGTHFDVFVEAIPQTQTLSLDGGVLMSTEMSLALSRGIDVRRQNFTWGIARGAIFVNPFIDRSKPVPDAALRRGSIPGGGTVVKARGVRLELRAPDYRMAEIIQRRLNQRFGAQEKVATAKTPSLINLTIPRAWRKNYRHFLRLVMHTYLLGGSGAEEEHAKQLARAILLPTARHEDISLVWEAMGRQVLPVLQSLYASDNPGAGFYAARAGLCLEDPLALEPMMLFAQKAKSPYQIPAIRELGRARRFVRPVPLLRDLLSSEDELVRTAAYEALLERGGGGGAIRRRDISGQFTLDVVETKGRFVVYASRSGSSRIVLFGRHMPVRLPVFYSAPDELVTITAEAKDRKLTVFRKIPRTGQMSDAFKVNPTVADLVRTLGSLPTRDVNGRIAGLGLTYSQVVGVLYGLCKEGHIPARFVLQTSPEVRRIYISTPGAGRPDMPEEGP